MTPPEDLRSHVEELHRLVEPGLRPPPFETIRHRYERRRRTRQAAAVTGGTLALAAFGLTAVAVREPARPVTGIDVAADPVIDGAFAARDVAFVDARNGWALGARCDNDDICAMGISRTRDGGDTWTAPATFGPTVAREDIRTATAPGTGAARSIRFVDGHLGFAFNPALYVTTDGGRVWHPVGVPGQVVGVSAAGDVWLTTRSCPTAEAQRCTARVLTLAGGTAVAPLPAQPPVAGRNVLLRRAGGTAYVLSYQSGAQRLVRSTDGGATWTDLTPPCEQYDHQHVSVPASTVVWVACTVENDTRTSAKTVYVSADAGATWSRRGTPADLGVTNDLDAVSPTTAYLSSSHGDLLVTTDGGTTWRVAQQRGGYINLEFLDAGTGWFFGPKGALWRWRDGAAERIEGPR